MYLDNKRKELICKCRHKDKVLLRNVKQYELLRYNKQISRLNLALAIEFFYYSFIYLFESAW